ncbi:MAG: hypothetical protein IVW56_06920 [Candidatus Binataceae bacterium]|nr:hypothetical protein [Candidatus Binataceae bacterium]
MTTAPAASPAADAPASDAGGRLLIAPDAPIVGVDVGENTLFLAILAPGDAQVRFHAIDVAGALANSAGDPLARLADAIVAAAPILRRPGAVALIDSPRWPRDLDLSAAGLAPKGDCHRDHPPGRLIDARLHRIVRAIRAGSRPRPVLGLWMFPTPPFDYFARCAAAPRCPPHLARLFGALLGGQPTARSDASAPTGGQTFTRFMLTGFAAFRALEAAGVASFESYPDLVYRLWTRATTLIAKRRGKSHALAARSMIVRAIAGELRVAIGAGLAGLDQADAAMLALSAAAAARDGAIALIGAPCEGRFALPLRSSDAAHVAFALALAD